PKQAETAPRGLRVERARLGRVHVGAITAQPNKAWTFVANWRTAAKGDTPLIRGVSDNEDLRLSVRHTRLAFGDAPCAGRGGLGGAFAASQPTALRTLLFEADCVW